MNKETSLRTEKTKEILENQIRLKYGTLPVINQECSEIVLPANPSISNPINLDFVRGLVDGDGSFNVSFATNRRRISVNFTVVC